MSLRYTDLLDIMMQRGARLGLLDEASQKVDATEMELYLFQALLNVSETHDLEAYLINNPQIAATSAGINRYAVPADYGRLITPRVQNRRGMYVFDGVRTFDLEYLDPNGFSRLVSAQNAPPVSFTVMRRQLWLYPTPDSNNGVDYTIRGLYVERVGRPDLDEEVMLSYPTVLVDEALFILAGDMNRVTSALAAKRAEGLSKLIGGPMGRVAQLARAAVYQGSASQEQNN
jgi:hypothetical protein